MGALITSGYICPGRSFYSNWPVPKWSILFWTPGGAINNATVFTKQKTWTIEPKIDKKPHAFIFSLKIKQDEIKLNIKSQS